MRKITSYIRKYEKRERQIQEEEEFQAEYDDMGGRKRKRQKVPEKAVENRLTDEEIDAIVSELIHTMNRACENDIENNRNKKIAYHKLDMLNDVLLKLLKPDWREKYIQHGVLSVIRKWLEPLPDRTIPNIKIRTGMLKILESVSNCVILQWIVVIHIIFSSSHLLVNL